MAIRIIGGQLKGRKLIVPDVQDLRPTPDRIRTTLFNWLQMSIQDAVCLDCFAGSGALGLEAYSRGARSVYALENHPKAFQKLAQYRADWNLDDRFRVSKSDVLQWMLKTDIRFDVIFLDPPFKGEQLIAALETISARNLLKPEGLLYIECAKGALLPENLKVLKSTQAGEVEAGLYEFISI